MARSTYSLICCSKGSSMLQPIEKFAIFESFAWFGRDVDLVRLLDVHPADCRPLIRRRAAPSPRKAGRRIWISHLPAQLDQCCLDQLVAGQIALPGSHLDIAG